MIIFRVSLNLRRRWFVMDENRNHESARRKVKMKINFPTSIDFECRMMLKGGKGMRNKTPTKSATPQTRGCLLKAKPSTPIRMRVQFPWSRAKNAKNRKKPRLDGTHNEKWFYSETASIVGLWGWCYPERGARIILENYVNDKYRLLVIGDIKRLEHGDQGWNGASVKREKKHRNTEYKFSLIHDGSKILPRRTKRRRIIGDHYGGKVGEWSRRYTSRRYSE